MLKKEKPTLSVANPAFKEGRTIRELIEEIKISMGVRLRHSNGVSRYD